jgi:O-antigen/teichoic acid export membrane protein
MTDMALRRMRSALGGRAGGHAAWLFGGQVVGGLATLIATPIELDRMGPERYAAVVLLAGIVGYLTVLDVGSGWAVTRSVSRHLAAGERTRAAEALGSGLVLVVAIGALGTIVLVLLAPAIVDLLSVQADVRPDVVAGLRVLALSLPVVLASVVLAGVGRSLEMFRLSAILSALHLVVFNAAWVALAGRANDVVWVVGAQAVIVLATCAVWAGALWRREPVLLRRVRARRAEAGELFRFGRQYLFTQAGYGALTQADKPILAIGIPVSLMPQYTIPFAVASRVTMLSTPVATVLFPRLVAAAAENREEKLVDVGGRSIRLVSIATGAALALIVFGGRPFLELWIGESFAADAYAPLLALAVGFSLLTVGSPAGVLLDARDRPEVHARLVAGGGAIGLGAGGVLGGIFATPTAGAIGIGVGLAVIGLAVLEASHRLAPAWSRRLMASMALVPLAALLAAGAAAAALAAVIQAGALVTLLIVAAATTAAAGALVWVSHPAPHEESDGRPVERPEEARASS